MTRKFTPYFSAPFYIIGTVQYGKGDGVIPLTVEKKLAKPFEKHAFGAGYRYDNATDLYLLDLKKGKLISVDKGVILTSPSVAWNEAGDKMLYVVLN